MGDMKDMDDLLIQQPQCCSFSMLSCTDRVAFPPACNHALVSLQAWLTGLACGHARVKEGEKVGVLLSRHAKEHRPFAIRTGDIEAFPTIK